MNIGLCRRSFKADSIIPLPIMGNVDAVELMTISNS